jgi:folate-binding protein YgfZ
MALGAAEMTDGTQATCAVLGERGVLAVGGDDRVAFLQGLVSNDVGRLAPDRALYSLFLTAQGKFLHDFMMVATGDAILLDVEAARRDDLLRRLKVYRLRSKVTLDDRGGDCCVLAFWGEGALERLGLPAEPGAAAPFAAPFAAAPLAGGMGVAFTDPRLAGLGARAVVPMAPAEALAAAAAAGFAAGDATGWDSLRLSLGVPDGSRDMTVDKAIPLENNLDDLNAISWDKGCYLGQELTARTRYRALIRRRLFPVRLVEGPPPEPGTPVRLADGREIGEIRSVRPPFGLAMLRLEELADGAEKHCRLDAGPSVITAHRPDWATF